MTASLNESSGILTEKLVNFLWNQWSSLGLAGYANSKSPFITDPEALVLLSTTIARHDPRLFGEIHDWLRENELWINLQRLRYLMREDTFGEATVLGAMAERISQENRHSKWKFIIRHIPIPADKDPAPFFFSIPLLSTPEPVFARWGWLRGPVEFREMSQPPRTDQPAAFLFKLREALDEAMPALVRAGVAHELRSTRNLRGADLVRSLLADIHSLLG